MGLGALKSINVLESLILAQDERWRYALYMQVERGTFHWKVFLRGGRVRNA